MGELEDKLNSILSSPEEMEKIMGIARSLSGTTDNTAPPAPKAAKTTPDIASAASALGDIDPKMFKLMSRIMGEYTSGKNDKTALLTALKPYLKKERHEQIDRAAQIAKLARIAKAAFSEFSGGDSGV
jgi:hypothetical protein